MFKDGSQAWDAKDYLIQQERCKVVTIENKHYSKNSEVRSFSFINYVLLEIILSYPIIFLRLNTKLLDF